MTRCGGSWSGDRRGPLLPRHAGLVHRRLRRRDPRPGGRLGRDQQRQGHPGRRPHRLGQDPLGVPVVARPARQHPAPGGPEAALPGPLRQPAQGARRRRRAQPARAADRHPAGRPAPRPAGPRHPRGHPLRRHPARGAPGVRQDPAGRLHHDAGVAVPRAHQRRPRGAGGRRDGDPGRGARGRRAPSAAPTSPSPWSGWTPCSSGPPSASACRPRCVRSTRSPASSAARAR